VGKRGEERKRVVEMWHQSLILTNFSLLIHSASDLSGEPLVFCPPPLGGKKAYGVWYNTRFG
jgi:hypothetical protein